MYMHDSWVRFVEDRLPESSSSTHCACTSYSPIYETENQNRLYINVEVETVRLRRIGRKRTNVTISENKKLFSVLFYNLFGNKQFNSMDVLVVGFLELLVF